MDKKVSKPLQGLKVVELSHLIAGPYCCMLLGGEGADVIKIEPPQGELSRHREPIRRAGNKTFSAYFGALNRNKRSLVLDLKNETGMATFRRILAEADVLVTNMRAKALTRLGLHPKTLRNDLPRLVIACISGFGLERAGEYTDRAGLAMVAEALSGSISLSRDHAGNPVWCGFALGDIAAGMTAHSAILLALRNQEKYGEGALLDLSLTESMLPMVSVALSRIQVTAGSENATTTPNDFHGIPYGAYRAADGHISIGVNSDAFWKRFCVGIGRPDLGQDPRYATYLERAKRHDEVNEITEQFTCLHTREKITELLNKVDVPVAPILNMREVLAQGYFQARGALQEFDDGIGGKITLPVDPTSYETVSSRSIAPQLGEHRDQILAEYLGLDQGAIDALGVSGAFGGQKQVGI
jgi:crotonobetainyl-CoA:carnitine CoA-transferase CaiB-like acyl-CoA transferase